MYLIGLYFCTCGWLARTSAAGSLSGAHKMYGYWFSHFLKTGLVKLLLNFLFAKCLFLSIFGVKIHARPLSLSHSLYRPAFAAAAENIPPPRLSFLIDILQKCNKSGLILVPRELSCPFPLFVLSRACSDEGRWKISPSFLRSCLFLSFSPIIVLSDNSRVALQQLMSDVRVISLVGRVVVRVYKTCAVRGEGE